VRRSNPSLSAKKETMSNKIQLDCRYKTKLTSEQKEDARIKRMVNGYDDDEEVEQYNYIYGKIVFDINDVKMFNEVDEDHICIRLYDGDSVTVKIDYINFCQIFSTLTGCAIRDVNDFVMKVE
jgi:hypothetical protein